MEINRLQNNTSSSRQSGGLAFSSDDFMILLIAELQNQDPLSPMDSQQLMTQLAQMQIVAENRMSRESQDMTQAIGLIGREVQWLDGGGGMLYSGQVTGVYRDGSEPVVMVGNVGLKLSQIMAIS
jgi:flagellar basal-body rod modification protein FlgD